MIRLLAALLLASGLTAAEPSDVPVADPSGLLAAAARAQAQAETALERARLRIADERAAATAALQRALAASAAARVAARQAETAAAAAEEALAQGERQVREDAAAAARLVDQAGLTVALTGTPDQRLAAARASLAARLDALPGRLALAWGELAVADRTGALRSLPVLRLGEARAVALGTDAAGRGLLVRSGDGGWLVAGPDLPPAALDAHGRPLLVMLDAGGHAAGREVAPARSLGQRLADWLAAGRLFIWPILAVLVCGLAVAAVRGWDLWRQRADPRRLVLVTGLWARGAGDEACRLVAAGATPLDRLLRAGLAAVARAPVEREAAVEQALIAEAARSGRGLPALAVLAGVAPLLGLLGTVTGMIDLFAVIAAQGSGNARSLSGGIAEALVCTQAGMIAAIPLLLLHAWLGRIAERRGQLLDEAASGVLGLAPAGSRALKEGQP